MINYQTNLRTYGDRIKINLTHVAYALILLALVTPLTNWTIPIIIKKIKGVVYL